MSDLHERLRRAHREIVWHQVRHVLRSALFRGQCVARDVFWALVPAHLKATCSACGTERFEKGAQAAGWIWVTCRDGECAYMCRNCARGERDDWRWS